MLLRLKISDKEKTAVIKVLKANKNKTISIAKIADKVKGNANRIRFVVELLIEENKIKKVPTKNFNEHYKRYTYEVI